MPTAKFTATGSKPQKKLSPRKVLWRQPEILTFRQGLAAVSGLTEDIIIDLARFPEFEVVGSNSSAVYRDGRAAAAELGAAFVVQGSFVPRRGSVLGAARKYAPLNRFLIAFMRRAGFPLCSTFDKLKTLRENPSRLPECET